MEFLIWFLPVLAGTVIVVVLTGQAVNAYDRVKRRARLSEDLVKAIKHTQPTWERMLLIGQTAGFGRVATYDVIKSIYCSVLIGKDVELQQHKDLLESYIEKHRQAEPFEGLPPSSRIHLERIYEELGESSYLLEPLATNMRELVSVYERDKALQRRYTTWSFFLGIAGAIFAAYTYYYPNGTSSAPPERKTQQSPSSGDSANQASK